MVTSTKGVSNDIPSDKVQQRELSDTGFHDVLSTREFGKVQERQSDNTEALTSHPRQDGSELTMMVEKGSNNCQLKDNPDSRNQASESNQSIIPEEASDDMHQRPCPESGIRRLQSNQEGNSLSEIPDKELDNLTQRQSPETVIHSPESNQERKILSIGPEKGSYTLQETQGPDAGVSASESDQEKIGLIIRPEKVLDKLPLRRNPDSVVHPSQSDQEGVSFSRLPEKPSEDGYNWRKYGQKLVRGNVFVRSYYKCTFPNCPARKQVERSHDGRITEINYLWKHEHPKPQHTLVKGTASVMPIQARGVEEPSETVSEDDSPMHGVTSQPTETTKTPLISAVAVSQSGHDSLEFAVSQSSEIKSEVHDDCVPDSKKQKRDVSSVKDAVVTKTSCEPRVVVQTTSEVDIVNDGYRWRKYGQKLVKGNPNPRSYYRCSSAGCPVKKHVERASYDQKVVITTYEGRHHHDIPAGRTVTPNTSGNTTSTTSLNGDESRIKQEANETVGLDMAVHISAN